MTRFWLTGPSAVQVPSGVTGDSSTPVNSPGSSAQSLASVRQTLRGSLPTASRTGPGATAA